MHARLCTTAFLSALALSLGSCVIPAQEALKNSAGGPQNSQAAPGGDAANAQGLIKPMIPPEAPPRPGESLQESEVPKPIRVVVDRTKAPSPPRQEWEDQKVKAAAQELAKSIPNVQGIKLCYMVKNDEWRVTLYEDIGPMFDVKQFFWDREQDKFQPHLVQVRIAKNALDRHLAESDLDQACETLEPGPVPRSAEIQPPRQGMPTDISTPQ